MRKLRIPWWIADQEAICRVAGSHEQGIQGPVVTVLVLESREMVLVKYGLSDGMLASLEMTWMDKGRSRPLTRCRSKWAVSLCSLCDC
jgi:hypothetical protein